MMPDWDVRRIAMVCYHTSPLTQPGGQDAGGMNVYVRELALELARCGLAVDIFTRATGRRVMLSELAPGVRVIPIEAGPLRRVEKQRLAEFLPRFVQGIAAWRIHAGLRYDVLHSHYWLSGLAGLQLQRRWAIPHVTMFHTLGEVKNRSRLGEREPATRIEGERAVVRGADGIVSATDHERRLLTALYDAESAHIVTIPCGVDVDRFQPAPVGLVRSLRNRLGLAADKVIVYAGRIEPLKGLDVVVEALAQLDAPRPLFLIVGGDGGAKREIERLRGLAQRHGVTDRVRFVGAVPQADLALYYSLADVVVAPSYYESFGMAALEAQACGTPVVAARVGGLPDAIRDGRTGFLVPWRCPQPFSEQLDLLLRNEGLRRRFGESARSWALGFAWNVVADGLMALYDSLLSERYSTESCHAALLRWSKSAHDSCEVA